MHPLVLVGFDLVVSVLLLLLGMFVVWSRFRTQLEEQGSREIAATFRTTAMDNEEPGKFSVEEPHDKTEFSDVTHEEPHDETEFSDVTQIAATLEEKGCSTEQIARRLQIPTREVEMVLAISRMNSAGTVDRGTAVVFPWNPDAARPV
jgi:hypothetical protein